jgi:4-hydroxy-tetrahydrodipicolinate reductase
MFVFRVYRGKGSDSVMTNIAVCGVCGKMGRVVVSAADGRKDCAVVAGLDVNAAGDFGFPVYKKPSELPVRPDVIIDFSHPDSLNGLLEYGLSSGAALVLATTGYGDAQIEQIKRAAQQIPVFFSFNMSLGINLLVKLSKTAAEILGAQFDVEIIESHHNLKIDAPSGTALMLADAVNETRNGGMEYVFDRHKERKKRTDNEIGIHSVRGGTIVGRHEVIFAGRDEVITLSHAAASKEVFAAGAVSAAVFLSGKPAGLYDMGSFFNCRPI